MKQYTFTTFLTLNKKDFEKYLITRGETYTAKIYKDPHELAQAIQDAMNAVSAETYTVVYSNTDGKYTIATSTSAIPVVASIKVPVLFSGTDAFPDGSAALTVAGAPKKIS